MFSNHRLLLAFILVPVLCGCFPFCADAQTEGEKKDSLSEELEQLRVGVTKAYVEKDLDLLLTYCADDVIAVWQNGMVAKGHQGVRDVVNELTQSGGLIVDFTAAPEVEHRTVLSDGNVVVSMGRLNDTYTVRGIEEPFAMHSIWTVALTKFDGKWLINSFHVSCDAFDNKAITAKINAARLFAGVIAGIAALVIGLVISYFWTRKSKSKTTFVAE